LLSQYPANAPVLLPEISHGRSEEEEAAGYAGADRRRSAPVAVSGDPD
jgi:hypothetical protein